MKSGLAVISALIWMTLIFYASSFPGSATGPDTRVWVFFLKTLHFVNFGILALLFLAVLKGNRRLLETPLATFAVSLVLTVLYALSDEYHQKFSPGRHPSIRDVVIDALGAAFFLGACLFLKSKKEKSEKLERGQRRATNHT